MSDAARKASPLAKRLEVVEFLRISRKTFDRHVRPHLTAVMIGKRTMYRWEEVEGSDKARKGRFGGLLSHRVTAFALPTPESERGES